MPTSLLELLGLGYADLLLWGACIVLANPIATLVHELGHAVAALRLTEGHVLITLTGWRWRHLCLGRLHVDLGLPAGAGWCVFTPSPGRHTKAKIAAAGPLASFAAGAVCAGGWLLTGWVPVGALAAVNLLVAVANAAPRRIRDHGEWQVSDGLWVARSFGLVGLPRRPAGSEPILSRPYAVLLAPVLILVLAVRPALLLLLVPLFALGWHISVRDREAAAPRPPETWDTSRSVGPPGPR